MKKIFLLSMLCCLLAPVSHALTVTGQIIDARTGQTVPFLRITLRDSLGLSAPVSGTTTSTGAYNISWSGTPVLNQSFQLTLAPTCGVVRTVSFRYTGSSTIVNNITVCQGTANYNLQGIVSLSSGANTGGTTIHLVGIGTDSTATDSIVVFHDSFKTLGGSNGFFFKTYQQIPPGRLFLKAELDSAHPKYRAYLPTYFSSYPSWQTASTPTINFFVSDTARIQMIDTIRSSGIGCISGVAQQNGVALPGRIIILTSGNNVAADFTYTDGAGRFSFNNLALGTYKVYGDVIPKLNPALTMTLTSTKPCINSLVFEETAKTFIARLVTLAVAGSSGTALDGLQPAPNPVTGWLRIEGSAAIEGPKQLTVRDLSGRVLDRLQFGAGRELRIDATPWPAGMYFLQLQTAIGTRSYRVQKGL